jgi:hypothetical protein
VVCVRDGFDTQTLRQINAMVATHHLVTQHAVNKTG